MLPTVPIILFTLYGGDDLEQAASSQASLLSFPRTLP
jgi:hypothetical protein